ncbi:MAG: 4Fe-4S dicluster domain-containing protein [Candidatus Thorarchaeota archaeon]
MCKWCFKHGDGGKWYNNARLYSDELADEYSAREYLEEQWDNMETLFIRKIFGFNSIGLGYKMQMPIIGRIIRWKVENQIHNEGPRRNPARADGHFGQVIPLEDAQHIMGNLAAEPIIKNYCVCRWMQRGVKDAVCINFGQLSGVIEKHVRYIPNDVKYKLDREEAIAALEEQNKRGYVASVWFQPVPYINAICSCETPECGGLRLRNDFNLDTVYKAEYVIDVSRNNCQGCKSCIRMCQFNALRYLPSIDKVIADLDKCFGCGVCRHACEHDALQLVHRESVPGMAGRF